MNTFELMEMLKAAKHGDIMNFDTQRDAKNARLMFADIVSGGHSKLKVSTRPADDGKVALLFMDPTITSDMPVKRVDIGQIERGIAPPKVRSKYNFEALKAGDSLWHSNPVTSNRVAAAFRYWARKAGSPLKATSCKTGKSDPRGPGWRIWFVDINISSDVEI